MITRRNFAIGTASSLSLLLFYSANKLLDQYWKIAIQKGYIPTKHEGYLDQKYLEMVNKLRGHSCGLPSAPYRWRAAFEDVIGRCFQYIDEEKISGNFYAIEQFTRYVHAARDIAENRDIDGGYNETERALGGVVLQGVLEKDINNLFHDDQQQRIALETTKRFVDLGIPTEKFLNYELKFVRTFARRSFAKRWSGYRPT